MAKRERKEEKKTSFVISSPFSSSMKKRNISFQSCFWRCRLTLSLSHASKAKQPYADRSLRGNFKLREGGYQR
jgi:hypothetical protein